MLYLKPVACVSCQQGETWAGGWLGGPCTLAFCDHLTEYLEVRVLRVSHFTEVETKAEREDTEHAGDRPVSSSGSFLS